MPVIRPAKSLEKDGDVVRVLVTGFGPFRDFKENPSWLAVKRLHNVILETEPTPEPVLLPSSFSHRESGSHFPEHLQQRWRDEIEQQEVLAPTPPPERSGRARPTRIHITALYVPVTYPAVLDTIPKLHARPPVLPHTDRLMQPARPPQDGYDFILHVGVGQEGGLKIEKRARRWGYGKHDADGGLCDVGRSERGDGGRSGSEEGEAEKFERERLGLDKTSTHDEDAAKRGFGGIYDGVEDELRTEVDVDGLVDALRESGFEHVDESTDAGLYLCEFIYYCSLAESQRIQTSQSDARADAKSKDTKVLFVHCPPLGKPYESEEVAQALKSIVEWVVLEDMSMSRSQLGGA